MRLPMSWDLISTWLQRGISHIWHCEISVRYFGIHAPIIDYSIMMTSLEYLIVKYFHVYTYYLIPTVLLKSCLDSLLPHITAIITCSLSYGIVQKSLKIAQFIVRLKKPALNHHDFKTIDQYLTWNIFWKLLSELPQNSLKNTFNRQVYMPLCNRHNTETALLRIHNNL